MDWTNAFMILIPIVGSGLVTWLINRRKDGASAQLMDAQAVLYDAQTIKTMRETQEATQRQVDYLSDRLAKTRAEMEEMEARYEQQMADLRMEYETQIEALRAEYEGKLSYMRRKINLYTAALNKHNIKVDGDKGDL